MQDMIIKGDGTSRKLKLGNLPSTYEEFAKMGAAGELLMDLLINLAGVVQMGTPYSKAACLPDELCDYLGIARESELKDALRMLSSRVYFNNYYTAWSIEQQPALQYDWAGNAAAGESFGGKAWIIGGTQGANAQLDTVTMIDDALVINFATPLSAGKAGLAACRCGEWLLAAGGYVSSAGSPSDLAEVYSVNGMRTGTAALSQARQGPAPAKVGSFALFMGGYPGTGYSAAVDAYDANLVRTDAPSLSRGRADSAGGQTENYAFCVAGTSATYLQTEKSVDAYDANLVRTDAPSLSGLSGSVGAGAVGGHLIVVSHADKSAEVYDDNLVRTVLPGEIPYRMSRSKCVSFDDCAIFAGTDAGGVQPAIVFDVNLVRTTIGSISPGSSGFAAAAAGNYAIFAGGRSGSELYFKDVQIFKFAPTVDVTIPAFSQYELDDITDGVQQTISAATIRKDGRLNGWMAPGGFTLRGLNEK